MVKQTKPGRTRPLDRDGDGNDGGSLRGNKTAPYAEGAGPDAEADKAPPPEWDRDDEYILDGLSQAVDGEQFDLDKLTLEAVVAWPPEQAYAAETWFEDVLMGEDGQDLSLPVFLEPYLSASLATPATPTAEAAQETDPATPPAEATQEPSTEPETQPEAPAETPSTDAAQEPDPEDTFDPEQIAAGGTPVIEQEGEAVTTAAEASAGAVLGEGEVVQLEGRLDLDAPPIAVRLHELRQLTEATRLYQSPEGYSATYGAPFIAEATVKGWIAHGLAEAIPSAGNTGGVRATDFARQVVRDAARSAAA